MEPLLQLGLSNALMATILAVLVMALGRLCRRPALLHCLWLLVLVKLITPSWIACPLPWPDRPKPTATAFSIPEPVAAASFFDATRGEPNAEMLLSNDVNVPESSEPIAASPLIPLADPPSLNMPLDHRSDSGWWSEFEFPLWETIAALWLAGAIGWFGVIAYRIYRFRDWLRCARPASPMLCAQVQHLAERMGMAVCPTVWLLPGHVSPMVWALGGRPRLFVSSALWDRLTADQQSTLLVHELAHLRRRDHWVRGLELLVSGLYWWHPIVWWARHELREAEEQCCDAWVVWTLPQSARTYANALLETIDFLSETPHALPAVASGIGHVHHLRRRLTMIMRGTTPRTLSGMGLVVVLGLGAFFLALRPIWAQTRAIRQAEEQRQAAEAAATYAEEALAQREEADRQESRSKINAERDRIQAEREKLAAEVDRMKANLQRAMSDLKRAESRLAELQERQAAQQRAQAGPQPTPRPRRPTREQVSDPEQRISELERKLDELLNEVQSLRREMRRSGRQGPMSGMAPGMPGGLAPAPAGRPGAMRPPGSPSMAIPPASALPHQPGQPIAPALAPLPPTPVQPVLPGARPALAPLPPSPTPPEPPAAEVPSSISS